METGLKAILGKQVIVAMPNLPETEGRNCWQGTLECPEGIYGIEGVEEVCFQSDDVSAIHTSIPRLIVLK